MDHSIRLIGLPVPAAAVPTDRGGGQPHGFITRAVAEVTGTIPYEQFAAQLEDVVEKVRAIAERLKVRMGEYEAEEIKIGLAVSSEGSIGVATAGVEASIEVSLKRKNARASAT